MKRELREVLLQMGELERAMAEKRCASPLWAARSPNSPDCCSAWRTTSAKRERQAMTSGHTLRQLESEMARVRERLSTYERELRRVGEERSERESVHRRRSWRTVPARRTAARAGDAEMQAAQSSLEVAAPAARRSRATGQRSPRAIWRRLEERRRGAMLTVQRIEAMVSEVSAHLAS